MPAVRHRARTVKELETRSPQNGELRFGTRPIRQPSKIRPANMKEVRAYDLATAKTMNRESSLGMATLMFGELLETL